VQDAEDEVEDAKAVLKKKKDFYDECVSALRSAVREGPRRYPLFDNKEPQPGVEAASSTPAEAPAESPAPVPADDETWRTVSISELGITGKLAESLTEAGLTTMGAIADWGDSGKLLTDVPGVGPAKAEKIENATAEYWARHPRFQAEETEVPGVEGEESPAEQPQASEKSAFDVAYIEGREACEQGVPSMQNPHPANTPERDGWNAGWNTQFAEETGEPVDSDFDDI